MDEALEAMVGIVTELGDERVNLRPDIPLGASQGGALLHLSSELAQHRGQMEIFRDLLLTSWVRLSIEPWPAARPESRYRQV